jgi:hypothetical protein
MGRKKELNYNSKAVHDFLNENRIVEHFKKGRQVIYLNKYPIEDYHKRKISSWGTRRGVTLSALDEVLVRYGMSIREFETWCEHRGIDPVSNGGTNDHTAVDT